MRESISDPRILRRQKMDSRVRGNDSMSLESSRLRPLCLSASPKRIFCQPRATQQSFRPAGGSAAMRALAIDD
jgi:hypothetical protein